MVLGALAAPATAADTAAPPPAGEGRWITQTIAGMTVEEKVGQLFSTHVYGTTVDSYDANNVAEFGLGTPREIIAFVGASASVRRNEKRAQLCHRHKGGHHARQSPGRKNV